MFPLRVGVDAFSVFKELFSGLVKNLQHLFSAFGHQLHELGINCLASYKPIIILSRGILDYKKYISLVTDRLLRRLGRTIAEDFCPKAFLVKEIVGNHQN
jgi:hypothetical protein